MDYEDARRIGDAGEVRVTAELTRLQPLYGFSLMNNVLLSEESRSGTNLTAQFDHVLIDNLGILIIETKTRTNALLRGTFADKNWTACYPGGRTHTFQNPLRQNDEHMVRAHKVLKEQGLALPLERIRGLVVFVDTDTSRLELDSVTQERVATLDEVAERIKTRNDFMIQTPMSNDERAALTDLLTRLDRSGDEAAWSQHESYVAGASGGKQSTAPGDVGSTFRVPTSPEPPRNSARTVLAAVLALAVLGFLGWVAWGVYHGTAPTWVWIGLFIVLFALGGEQKSSRRRRKPTKSTKRSKAASEGSIASLLVPLVALLILFGAYRNWGALTQSFISVLTPTAPVAAPVAAPVPQQPNIDIALARQQLQKTAPDVYGKVDALDSPEVTMSQSGTTYRWKYLAKTGANAASVKRVSITLAADGRVAGFEVD